MAENVCPVVTRLFERKQKSTIMKSEGRTNIADKDKTRTMKKNKTSFFKKQQHHMEIITLKNKNMNISRNKKNTRIT